MKKIVSESGVECCYELRSIPFYLNNTRVNINIQLTSAGPYDINGLTVQKWFDSILNEKHVRKVDEPSVADPTFELVVEDDDVDYILLTLYRILKKLNPSIKSLAYELC